MRACWRGLHGVVIATAVCGLAGCAVSSAASHSAQGGTVISRGVDAAGGTFDVVLDPNESRYEQRPGHGRGGAGCETPIRIENSNGNSFSECLEPTAPALKPQVFCDEPWLTIVGSTLPRTKSARLTTSNGKTITSRAVIVAGRSQRSAGLYYQVMRGPSPIPVSLTELGSRGEVLRTVALPHVVGCSSRAVKQIPSANRTLVRDVLADGREVSIGTEAVHYLGERQLSLKLAVAAPGKPGPEGAGASVLPLAHGDRSPLSVQMTTLCVGRRTDTFIYGILRRVRSRVIASDAGASTMLREFPIPPSLGVRGQFVYASVPWLPTSVDVRGPRGAILARNEYPDPPAQTCPRDAAIAVGMVG